MAFVRQQYGADYFSGANVTISIGPCILTQAAGIEYMVNNTKTRIFGYNSQYFDAIAKGLVQVDGRIYINFVSPRYLTTTIHRFYQTVHAWQIILDRADPSNGTADELANYLANTPEAVDLFSAMTQRLDIPEDVIPHEVGDFLSIPDSPWAYEIELQGSSPNTFVFQDPEGTFQRETFQPDFGVLLSDFFASDTAVDGLTRILWGDASHVTGSTLAGTAEGDVRLIPTQLEKQWSMTDIAGTATHPLDLLSSYARPDQLGHPIDGFGGIDIMISFGNVFDDAITDTTFQYDHSTARLLKDVHFIGESQTIMADNQPVMDAYSFFCRRVNPVSTPARVNKDAGAITQ